MSHDLDDPASQAELAAHYFEQQAEQNWLIRHSPAYRHAPICMLAACAVTLLGLVGLVALTNERPEEAVQTEWRYVVCLVLMAMGVLVIMLTIATYPGGKGWRAAIGASVFLAGTIAVCWGVLVLATLG